MAVEEGENPFRLPPDEQIFSIREQLRQKRAEDREKVKSQHVWEKTTSSIRIHRNRRRDDGGDDAQLAAEATRKGRGAADTAPVAGRDARREKKQENVADFVAKTREMFLVQMSLDVKKAEILKLDAKAKDKEDALNKSKQMLDEDVTRFDAFLGNNDQRAHRAMKQAEEMTKQKQDRITRIKQLKSQLSALQTEIQKHNDLKIEYLGYKEFLTNLTPLEWKDEQREAKRQRQANRRKRAVDYRMAEINEKMQEEIDTEERAAEEKERESNKGRSRRKKTEEEEAKEQEQKEGRRRRIRRKYQTREAVDAEYVEYSSGEEMPLYFQEPKQLLDIFVKLEESNLFLIQNSQDTEQNLEDLKEKFAEMRRTRGAMTDKMKQQISSLERQIADEQGKCTELRQTISQKRGGSEQEDLLKPLAEAVAEVHAVCSQEDPGDGDTLQMLGAVEAKLEDFLNQLDEAEEDGRSHQVEALEKKKERERRSRNLRQRKEQQERKIEERLKASLQRSQAPVHKKVGKQIMFRSAPLYQARKVVQEDDGFEEATKEHDVFGIWMGKDGVPNAEQPEKQT